MLLINTLFSGNKTIILWVDKEVGSKMRNNTLEIRRWEQRKAGGQLESILNENVIMMHELILLYSRCHLDLEIRGNSLHEDKQT